MNKVESAVTLFSQGFNCAQAVLSPFAQKAGMNGETALRVAGGFGAGMARLQETCGALTGGYMALGLFQGQHIPGDKDAKEKCYKSVREFTKKFEAMHGSSNCQKLLGVNLQSEEGQKRFMDEKMHTCKCEQYVKTAVELLDEIL